MAITNMAITNKPQNKAKPPGQGQLQAFSLAAPGAKKVQLVGDFTHWQEHPIPMQIAAGGVWRATVELTPGEHRYRFIVDGEWRDDPECNTRVANPFGSQDAVRQVAETQPGLGLLAA